MNGFPNVDPIPLPAPIWLFKLLHIVTLALHFVAMQMLVGGLLIAVLLCLLGRSGKSKTAAGAIARRLTIVMTYVINLGVPPLLFAQVLYGRAIYTSSVMIGACWISVVSVAYRCLLAALSLLRPVDAGVKRLVDGADCMAAHGAIAHIYSTNMTLMLRPEVWQSMYSASSLGTHLPTGDSTTIPRFCSCWSADSSPLAYG